MEVIVSVLSESLHPKPWVSGSWLLGVLYGSLPGRYLDFELGAFGVRRLCFVVYMFKRCCVKFGTG